MLPEPSAKPLSEESLFRNVSDLRSLFDQGFTYPNRPLMTNTCLPYKLHQVFNPGSFYIEITDMSSMDMKKSVKKALNGFKEDLASFRIGHAQMDDLWEQMPIVVAGQNFEQYFRAEVNVLNMETSVVTVTLVDTGAEARVKVDSLFLPSIDLIRYPKLALLCRLSQVVPIQGNWPDLDYASHLQGKKSSLVRFRDMDRGVVNVYLECDKVDVGLKLMMSLGCVDMPPLPFTTAKSELHVGKFPIYDFTDWVGITIPVYGIKVFDFNVALQLDSQKVNETLDLISNYVATTPDAKILPFKKERGSPCLALYAGGEDYNRATILSEPETGLFVVKFVDYWEFSILPVCQLMKIPDELINVPEGATICVPLEVYNADLDVAVVEPQLNELVVFKDLYCQIKEPEFGFVAKAKTVGVRLSRPEGEDGDNTSFAEIFNTSTLQEQHELIYFNSNPILASQVSERLLNGPSDFFADIEYTGVLSCAENELSVWLQLGDNGVKAEMLAEEMTQFYKKWNGPVMTSEMIIPGVYIACQQQDDPRWYRAKVISIEVEADRKLYYVMFLDYGNFDYVSLKSMKPLVDYFAREKCLALQVALPVTLKPEVELEALSDFILAFCEGEELSVCLQHKDLYNYAWIVKNGISLDDTLLEEGFLSISPDSNLGT